MRSSWLDRPILALDTETTGADPDTDRIVTVCVGRSEWLGDWRVQESALVNPGIPIPEAATKVHGITTEQAASKGEEMADVVERVFRLLRKAATVGTPVVLHNAIFDLTLLNNSFSQYLGEAMPAGLQVLDTLVLFRRFDTSTGSRTLENLAYRHGIRFPAHDAEADSLAALRLLHIIAAENDLLPLVPLEALHERQQVWSDAQQQALYWRRRGNGSATEPDIRPWPYGPTQPIRKDTA